ncbi:MAG: hypothetical protein KKC71_01355, partial [Chloroflexi bacterium]|nr:hypothetical protein [Chloroflexota bacterium]
QEEGEEGENGKGDGDEGVGFEMVHAVRKSSTDNSGKSNPNSLRTVTTFSAFCGWIEIHMSISPVARG